MRPPASPSAALVLAAALAAVLLGGCAARDVAVRPAAVGSGAAASPAGSAGLALSGAASFPASDVLRQWDRARSRAFAEADVAALRALYVAGSAAGTSDVRLLRDYLRRGLRVEGMHMQVLALDVVREGRGRLLLRVTDRLTGAEVVGRGSRVRLPRDRASTRVVDLRRTGGRWLVAGVRESARTRAAR